MEKFCKTNKRPLQRRKKKKRRKHVLKKYELSPEYTKIKINDFRKKDKKAKPKKKRKKKRKKKIKRFNPIYLQKDLGCDEWDYFDRISLEKEVLGDWCEIF